MIVPRCRCNKPRRSCAARVHGRASIHPGFSFCAPRLVANSFSGAPGNGFWVSSVAADCDGLALFLVGPVQWCDEVLLE